VKKEKKGHSLFSFRRIPMDIARLVCVVLLPIFRMKRITPEGKKYTKKIKGGAIIAANHTSFVDPFIVGVAFWYRRLFFFVAEVVMRGKLRSFFLKGVGSIKIDRNAADIESINRSIGILKEGYLLAVFPQGGIRKDDEIDTIKSGAVLMAMRAGVPIVPIHIPPRKKWYSRRTVVIGTTIDPKAICPKKFPSTADIKLVADALVAELCRCKSANDQNKN
jgi:1-acyl-sn-glycerol-3-phosphate acyltransferase